MNSVFYAYHPIALKNSEKDRGFVLSYLIRFRFVMFCKLVKKAIYGSIMYLTLYGLDFVKMTAEFKKVCFEFLNKV